MQQIQVIDSHTGGEPTRVIYEGGPDLGTGSLNERLERFRSDFDSIRRAVVDEPRGSDVWIGGLLCEPSRPDCCSAIIFFNTAGYLGMCGHGTIGVVKTLEFLRRISTGHHLIETPVGVVGVELRPDGNVTIQNVRSFRTQENVVVEVPGMGPVTGDVAWGGNWFFLIKNVAKRLVLENIDHLRKVTMKTRDALHEAGITGDNGSYIDHIELFGPPVDAQNDSRNFVLTPSGSYDRSPCGTGSSAKLACLAADGKLQPGETWRQESIVGSVFECQFQWDDNGGVIPSITGSAFVNAQSTLILDPDDPFCMGIR